MPRLGGRRIPPLASFLPAIMGATLLTLIGVLGVVGWNSPENMGAEGSPEGIAYWVMTVVYAPLLLWGPLLAVVAIASFRIAHPHPPKRRPRTPPVRRPASTAAPPVRQADHEPD